ncbi:hypothetical protein [Geobacillus sp. Y412MC52]|uniref:hypothetical protein n=1 Tax=unclassified Geobacillus TaxID=2642459 RepID=UPI00018C1C7A|nr:hypothetical protein [Geobacillus sp. Y412MC52]ADU95596.1 hypothetical protein GYMC52_3244 [Geobacillus sp. Y412MC52]ALA70060.1 hypothetical protein GT50_07470 [Geobacillus stearothermophilus 10]
MKKLLIVRSASMQQLDNNLKAIINTFPDYEYHMLTHEHSVKLVEKYDVIKKIIVYPYKQSFSIKRPVPELKNEIYDVVIIPVSNLTGAGFFNVFQFSLSLKSKRRIICNLISDLWDITPGQIRWMRMKHIMMSIVSMTGSIIAGLLVVLFLPFVLKRLEKKGE